MTSAFPRLPDHLAVLDDGPDDTGSVVPLKWCSLGEHWLPATREHFHVNRNLRSGLCASCIVCTRKARGCQPRKRRRSIRPGWLYCPVCDKDLEEEKFSFRGDYTDKRDSYCRKCSNKMKADSRTARLHTDEDFRKKERKRGRKSDRKRQRKIDEHRQMLLGRVRFLIRECKKREVFWSVLQRRTGVHQETLKRWAKDDAQLPNIPPMTRAIEALELVLAEIDTPGYVRLLEGATDATN